ncbi:hypothetical protein GJU94_13115 [Brucella sp. 10RB9214]|uniref:hypothetical protein n=1 Tax=unclassified Brucella TaxID=2632610 RepID=UPI0012ADE1DE|nr:MULTISPECIES: hypothetical protein [unclassified Brucella]MRN48087.1 hypothetical protein [Brucella sp. 10RB9212]MRN50761.1 hypothetical protein [Brucella sp. 10RB9214]
MRVSSLFSPCGGYPEHNQLHQDHNADEVPERLEGEFKERHHTTPLLAVSLPSAIWR